MVRAVVEIVVLLVRIYGRLKSQDYISLYDDKAVIKNGMCKNFNIQLAWSEETSQEVANGS